MWTRKDYIALALAAAATFSVTTAFFLPRVVNATGEAQTAKVLSPVLKLGECEVTAVAETTEAAPKVAAAVPVAVTNAPNITTSNIVTSNITTSNITTAGATATLFISSGAVWTPNGGTPGSVVIPANSTPKFKLVLKNPSDVEKRVAFTATLAVTAPSWGERGMPRATPKWNEAYDLVLKAGETREFEIDSKMPLALMSTGYLTLQSADDAKVAINALSFSVPFPVVTAGATAANFVAVSK